MNERTGGERMDHQAIGERIKAARKAKGLSQEQLGEMLGISESNVQTRMSRIKQKLRNLSAID